MRLTTASIRLATFALLALNASGCKSSITGPRGELDEARARWSMSAPAAYSVVVSRSCECLPAAAGPVLVTVRNGVAQSRRYTQTGESLTSTQSTWFPTVEELFTIIDAAIHEGIQPIDITYDATFGYPTRVFLGDTSADGGAAYFASDLHVQ